MIAAASLIDEETLAFLRATGGGELAERMDITTECLALTTAGFDTLPLVALEHLKKGIECHLGEFGRLYLSALALGFSRKGGMEEVSRIIRESLDVLSDGIEKLRNHYQ